MSSTIDTYKLGADELGEQVFECLNSIQKVAAAAEIEFLVVGAMARDIYFEHIHAIDVERATKDLDITVQVESWEEFERFTSKLETAGLRRNSQTIQRFYFGERGNDIPIDIVPFGALADENGNIYWPPGKDFEMSVLGFSEALDSAIEVRLGNHLTIKSASVEGLVLLKLISWIDRSRDKRAKDASDLWFVLKNYGLVPELLNEILDSDVLDEYAGELEVCVPAFLGRKLVRVISGQSAEFIKRHIASDPDNLEALALEAGPRDEQEIENRYRVLKVLIDQLNT